MVEWKIVAQTGNYRDSLTGDIPRPSPTQVYPYGPIRPITSLELTLPSLYLSLKALDLIMRLQDRLHAEARIPSFVIGELRESG
jgi:hypothetical protein